MPALKRPAASFAATSTKQARQSISKKDRAEKQLERQQASVAAALEQAQIPTGAKDLLLSVLPAALRPQPRHGFQEEAVSMLEKELLAIQKAFESRISELEGDVAGADAKRTGLQTAADEAHATLDAKGMAANEAKEKLDEASAQLKEAIEAQSKEDIAKLELFDSIDSAAAKIELLKETRALKERILSGEDASSADVVDSNLRQLVKDLNLVEAAKKCLKKNAGEHSQFEKLVLQQLDTQLATLEKQWVTMQSEGTQQKAGAEERVSVAVAKVEACAQAKESCKQALADATDAKKEADRVSKAMKKELKDFEGSVPGMQKKLDGARSKLTGFTQGALATFQKLKDGTEQAADEDNEEPQSQPDPETVESSKVAVEAVDAAPPLAPTETA